MVVGTLLSERYRIDERLAAGGMGAVYVATDERLGREVAVKVLKEELAHDERFVERFRREARAAGALAHPNVANVYDFAQDAGRHYMVMELVRGRDLARVLREEGPLDADRAAAIAAQIAAALHHAHSAGVVHRDIKPPNVIVADNDRIKVTDFGIARAVGDSTLTATGSVLGTAHYISPEQASGSEVGPAADIYSLGIVLYEMLTGSLPFTGDSAVAVAMRHLNDDVPPPSELNPDVPPRLDEVVARATAKEPAHRFADAAAMAAALDPVTPPTAPGSTAVMTGAGAATEVEQTVWPIPGSRWDPHRLGRRILVGFAILAGVALALLLLRLGDTAEERDEGEQAPAVEQQPAPAEDTIVVPDSVLGAPYDRAKDMLSDAGLSVERSEVTHDDPPGTVVDTQPSPGTELQEGDTITLIVSTGPEEEEEEEEEDEEKEDEEDKGHPHHSKGKGSGKDKKKDD